jgi:uncharacterized membrane protein
MPGAWLLALARFVFDDTVLSRVVDQTIADLRAEWLAAGPRAGPRLRARWLGYLAFWSLVFIAPFAFRKPADRPARGRWNAYRRSVMTSGTRVLLALILAVAGMTAGYAVSRTRPMLYRSVAVVQVVPARISAAASDRAWSVTSSSANDRLLEVSQTSLSFARLRSIIQEFQLYGAGTASASMEDAVELMRQRAKFTVDGPAQSSLAIVVSFLDENPVVAQKVAERLVSSFVDESLRSNEVIASGTVAFLEHRIQQTGERLTVMTEHANRIDKALPSNHRFEIEVLQNSYKSLLARREEALMAADLSRRQLGEQLKVLEPPRVPQRPEGPTRFEFSLVGGVAGLLIAALLALADSIRQLLRKRRGELATATT